METAGVSRASAGKADAVKTGRKVATSNNRLNRETVAPGLCNFLLAANFNGGVIAKLEEG